MERLLQLALALVVVAALPSRAAAQTENRFAIGANFSVKGATDETTHGHKGVGLLWRVGRGSEGWGWKFGLNWYSTEVERSLIGANEPFGELRIRPFLGGYGYTKFFGPAKVSANLMGGYAFNSFDMASTFANAYGRLNGASRVETDVANGFVLKPEVSTWFDVSRKIGLNVSAGYMIARPSITVTTPVGSDQRRYRADTLMFKVGAVYSIF
jgi:hypothetical protein